MYYKSREELMKINGWMEGEPSLELLEVSRYKDPGWRRKMLQQFPDADLNGDGELTAEEAVRYHASRVPLITPHPTRPLEWLPKEVSHWKVMVRMRDGVELGTEVYLPAGEGPFPVLITRGARKGGQLDLANWYLAKGFACVSQDLAPEPEPERRGLRDLQKDAYDLVQWVARQSWCNGNTAMFGYSAGGMTTLPVLFTNPPSLTALITHISCTDIGPFWRMNGGVSRVREYDPESKGGWAAQDPPAPDRPTILPKATSPEAMHCFHTDIGGWFDPFVQGSLDDWVKLKDTGKAVLVLGMDGHGWLTQPSRLPPDYGDADIFWPDVPQFDLLTGDVDKDSVRSVIFYFLMGDAADPDAPGNVWKATETWPIPHTPTSFHLTQVGKLQDSAPEEAGALTYAYDPNDPVAMIGGANVNQQNQGPLDQRLLKDRKDILRFATDPLEEPLEITGRMSVKLYISTDVPDTTFMAKLLDVYPDGYEAIIADCAVMARYHKGLYDPEPLEKGKVYEMSIDLFSTALVFAKGHRVGLHVTSSNAGRYAVHPNSYEPVEAYEGAPVANNTVHMSTEYPSRLILPVIAPGVSEDYDPNKHSLCTKTGDYDK